MLVKGREVMELYNELDFDSNIYVYVDFVKPGKHFYTVDFNEEFYLHKTIIRSREEDIVPFHKKMNFRVKEFNFEESCFADYRNE